MVSFIPTCHTLSLASLELVLSLFHPGVHRYWSPLQGILVKILSSWYCQTYNLQSCQVFVESVREQLMELNDTPSSPSPKPQPPLTKEELTVISCEPSPLNLLFLTAHSSSSTPLLTPTDLHPSPPLSMNISVSAPAPSIYLKSCTSSSTCFSSSPSNPNTPSCSHFSLTYGNSHYAFLG